MSIPRNKELMRVYKDLELVEQLGSGVPRILQHYDKECFRFMDSFTRMVFPSSFPVHKEEVQENFKVGLVDGLVDGLVESQRKIVRLIVENPKISKREMAKEIGISSTAIYNAAHSLHGRSYETIVQGSRLVKDQVYRVHFMVKLVLVNSFRLFQMAKKFRFCAHFSSFSPSVRQRRMQLKKAFNWT